MIRPIRIANDVLFKCEKNDTPNQKPQRCVTLRHVLGLLKVLPASLRCDFLRQFAVIQRGNLLSPKERVFLVEK